MKESRVRYGVRTPLSRNVAAEEKRLEAGRGHGRGCGERGLVFFSKATAYSGQS